MSRRCSIFILLLIISGCAVQRRPHTKPEDNVPVIVNEDTATAIHKNAATSKADIYDKLADAIKAGTVKTVNDSMNFTNPMFEQGASDYVKSINSLRKARLHDSDADLPTNAEQVFRLFAKEYRAAAK